jgi:ubiquinone/menaquinone biosynthesis C-methylase UbiE
MKDINHEAIEASTVYMMSRGVYLLQAHRFASSEMEHANRLLRWADPEPDAEIIDLGSGTGSLAAAWLTIRPDLQFTLANINKFQLDMSPALCRTILCDMEHVPRPDSEYDMALSCFAFGHADAKPMMQEAARLLRPGGVFFVYDMLPNPAKAAEMQAMHYELHDRATMEKLAQEAGLQTEFYMEPTDHRILHDRVPEVADVFHELQPVIYRFIKGDI